MQRGNDKETGLENLQVVKVTERSQDHYRTSYNVYDRKIIAQEDFLEFYFNGWSKQHLLDDVWEEFQDLKTKIGLIDFYNDIGITLDDDERKYHTAVSWDDVSERLKFLSDQISELASERRSLVMLKKIIERNLQKRGN